jgi:SET domain-containing protein
MEHTYNNFLKLIDLTEEQYLDHINTSTILSWNKDVVVKSSPIEGVGCFTTKKYVKDEEVGIVKYKDNRTTLGRFANHSPTPNVYLKEDKFLALKGINPNDELLVNYFANLKTLLMEEQTELKEEEKTEFDKFLERLENIESSERQCNIDDDGECLSCGG